MPHLCHAYRCETPCKAEFLMCGRHWAMVPKEVQAQVWKHYRPGQCDDKRPSAEWVSAAREAIAAVALAERLVTPIQAHSHGWLRDEDPAPSRQFRFVQLQQGTIEWRQWRDGGIGASDAAAILGVSPYLDAEQLLLEKTGRGRREQTFQMRRGNRLEPIARDLFTERTGIPVQPVCVESIDCPWLRASLDGWRDKGEVILEIKAPNINDHEYAIEGLVPPHYRPQLAHQCLATGSDEVFYCSYSEHSNCPPEHQIKIVRYRPDAEELGTLLEAEEQFWSRVVASRECSRRAS